MLNIPWLASFGYKHLQYRDWCSLTVCTVSIADLEAARAGMGGGGSPISVLTTASADAEIELRLYPPCLFISIFALEETINRTSRQARIFPFASDSSM